MKVDLGTRGVVQATAETPDAIAVGSRATQVVNAYNWYALTIRVEVMSVVQSPVLSFTLPPPDSWATPLEVGPQQHGVPGHSQDAAFIEHDSSVCPPGKGHALQVSATWSPRVFGPTYDLGERVLSPSC